MTHHPGARVVAQHPADAAGRIVAAITDDHHTGVLGEAHADPATVVQGDPGRPAGCVEQGVEQRPVGDGVGAVHHGLGLAVRARHRARIQVVAADDNGGFQLTVSHHLVEGQSQAYPIL